jgi:hypothetical protein
MENNETLFEAISGVAGLVILVCALSFGWFNCGDEEAEANEKDHIYEVIGELGLRVEQLEEETDALIDAVDELTPRSRRQSRESTDAELEELDRELGLIEPFVY